MPQHTPPAATARPCSINTITSWIAGNHVGRSSFNTVCHTTAGTKWSPTFKGLKGHPKTQTQVQALVVRTASKSQGYSAETPLARLVDALDQLILMKVHYFGESIGVIFSECLAAKSPVVAPLWQLFICDGSSSVRTGEAFFQHSDWPTAFRIRWFVWLCHRCCQLFGDSQIPWSEYLD